MTVTPKLFIGFIALAVAATACSSDAEETTTTIPAVEVADTINGLPADPGTDDRRVIGIKIDNHPLARPQSGLQEADAAYEILVEGGLTRFIALFHQSDSEFVGPVRSGRPTDSKVMNPLGLIQISGMQQWVRNIFRADGTTVIEDNGITTFRMPHRPGPHNLYATTQVIREYADDRNIDDVPPPPLFSYGEPTETTERATTITFDWSDAPDVRWLWNGTRYIRFNGSERHEWEDADGFTGQVTFDAIVVLMGRRYTASNPAGSGSSVPAIETLGTGEALVFVDGGVIEGQWAREEVSDPFELTAADGSPIVLEPARLWVAVFPDNRTVTWR